MVVMVVVAGLTGPPQTHLVGGDGGHDGVRDVVYVGRVVHHLHVRDVGGAVGRGRRQVLLAVVGRPDAAPAVAPGVGGEEDGGGGPHGLAQGLGVTLGDRHRLRGILNLTCLIGHLVCVCVCVCVCCVCMKEGAKMNK